MGHVNINRQVVAVRMWCPSNESRNASVPVPMIECHEPGQKWLPTNFKCVRQWQGRRGAVGQTFIAEAGRSGSQLVTSIRKVSAIP